MDHLRGQGNEFFEAACSAGLEGIISKRTDSAYRPGVRSRAWLKSKSKSYPRNVAWEWWTKKEEMNSCAEVSANELDTFGKVPLSRPTVKKGTV